MNQTLTAIGHWVGWRLALVGVAVVAMAAATSAMLSEPKPEESRWSLSYFNGDWSVGPSGSCGSGKPIVRLRASHRETGKLGSLELINAQNTREHHSKNLAYFFPEADVLGMAFVGRDDTGNNYISSHVEWKTDGENLVFIRLVPNLKASFPRTQALMDAERLAEMGLRKISPLRRCAA